MKEKGQGNFLASFFRKKKFIVIFAVGFLTKKNEEKIFFSGIDGDSDAVIRL